MIWNVIIDLAILVGASSIAIVTICRLDKMHRTTLRIFRAKYVALFAGALATGLSPWLFPDHPRLGGLLFIVAVLFYIGSGYSAWISKPPDYTESDRMPLDPLDPHDIASAVQKWRYRRSKR